MKCALALFAIFAGASPSTSAQSTSEALHRLFAEAWEFELQENPLLATTVGRSDRNHLLPSVSAEDESRRAVARKGYLDRLRGIDRDRVEACIPSASSE
jgi:uncharacterized protein (DUF885 family)